MNPRQKQIVRELINFENNTISNLSAMLAVSYRTIQNDIQQINSEIKNYEVQIVTATNKGVSIEANNPALLEKLVASLDEQKDFDNEELTCEILEEILSCKDYFKGDELAEQFFVSKKVINTCMANIKKILADYNLKLVSKPSYGSMIVGLDVQVETKIRRMILSLKNRRGKFYKNLLTEKEIEEITDIIKEQCENSKYVTTEESLNGLIAGILVAITRMKQQKQMDYEQSVVSYLMELEEYEVAMRIAAEISSTIHLDYDVQEVVYIARLMRAHRRLSDQDMENLENNIRADLDRLITKILDEIEAKYKTNLHDDIDLYISLGMHLVPLISRIKFNFHINNPIVKEVKRNYMLAFDMATTATNIIEEEFDIELSEDEIGYLAVHLNLALERKTQDVKPKSVLIVCSSGGGLSKLLEFKVKKNFQSRIKKVQTCNMYELKNMDISEFDYVLSTVKLDYQLSKPTLQISHMLTNEDVENFNEVLNTSTNEKSLMDVAKQELFYNDIKATDKQDALQQIILRLEKRIPLQADFLQQVLEREKLYSTEIGNSVVFPHPLVTTTPVSFISITVLKKPIKWENENIQVIMVANTKVGESGQLQLMYQQFAEFVSKKQNIIDLIKNPTYETFRQLVERK